MLRVMAGNRSSPPELNAYLSHLLDKAIEGGATATEIARKAGISVAHVSTIRTGQRGAGWKSVMGLAKALGKSLAELESEAQAWARNNPLPESRVERPERYPNRAVAAAFARASGVPDAAVRAVESLDLQSDEDLTPDEWLAEMRVEARRSLFGRTSGERLVDPEETRPNIPKPRK